LKVLLVRLSAFGDIIHTLPALCALRDHFPDAEIHWLVSRKCASLLAGHPDIDKLHVLKSRSAGGFLDARSRLGAERFDIAIDFQGLLKSGMLTWLSGAPRRIGRSFSHCREKPAALFYNERIAPGEKHVIRQNLELLGPLGISGLALNYRLALPEMMNIPDVFSKKPVAINVGAGWPTKYYPPEKWGELARYITDQLGHPVVVFWGPGEERDAIRVREIAPLSVIAPPTNYLEMGKLLTLCSVLISAESGPLHLSVAVGTPTVCLIGVTDPERNGPLDEGSRVILPPPPHIWDYRRKGFNPTEHIETTWIIEAVRSLLHEGGF